MKKITLPIICLALIGAASSCFAPNVDLPTATPGDHNARKSNKPRSCATMTVLAENMKEDPGLSRKMGEVDEQANRTAQRRNNNSVPYEGVITIPVRVHVVYNTAGQNISDAQIRSQIAVLNRDFRRRNADADQVPGVFADLVADMQIRFRLESIDRKPSPRADWGTRDAVKKRQKGGVDPIDPDYNLNIWVCNIGDDILGYAQFPGGKDATDGVVISPQFFGSSDFLPGGGFLAAPYDKGRTATHEVGHWLNLRHIWGDDDCGNDRVADTPTQQTYNFGCPTFPQVTCGNGPNGDLFMNFMDYTDDACMYMFTSGQTNRSRALFASDGARRTFVQ